MRWFIAVALSMLSACDAPQESRHVVGKISGTGTQVQAVFSK